MAAVGDAAATQGDPGSGPLPGAPERRGGLTPVSLFVVLLIGYVLIQVQFILILLLVSLVLATALDRPVSLLQRRLLLHRGIAILLMYVAFFGLLVLAGFLVAPAVRDQVSIFIDEAPQRLGELRASWQASSNGLLNGTGQDLLGNAIDALEDPPEPPQDAALTVLVGAVGGIIGIFATLVITFYYLMEREFIRRVVLNELSPRVKDRTSRIWDEAEAKVGGWLRGQLTLCLIIGVLSAIGYGLIGVPFWPVLAIWAGITEIIPVLGPWLGGIPAVILALTVSTEQGLIAIGFVIALQALENWVLVPRVMRGAVGLTPLTVFIAITAGAEFYGIVGTLLAIPVAAFVQVVITSTLRERRLFTESATAPLRSIPAWRWMRASSRDGSDPPPPSDDRGAGAQGSPGPTSLGRDADVTDAVATEVPTGAGAARSWPAASGPTTGAPSAPAGPSAAPSGGGPTAGPARDAQPATPPATRPTSGGPRWTPEHLRRDRPAPPAGNGGETPGDDLPPARRTAIGPGDR